MATATQTPEISADDITYVIAVKDAVLGGRKFEAADLYNGGATGTDMYEIACQWARTQIDADFEWLRKVARAEAKGKPGTCGLTDKAAAGVLNCLVAAQNRAARQTAPEPSAAPQERDQDERAADAYEAWARAQEEAAARAYEEYRAGQVQQGFYTVVDGGEHRTFKIGPWREDSYRPGGRIRWIGLLTGPDNTNDYETCARQTSDGQVTMYGYYRNSAPVASWLAGLMGESVEGHAAARLAYAVASGRCARCGRVLTVEASIHNGLGPECLKRVAGE